MKPIPATYQAPREPADDALRLHANEGAVPPPDLLQCAGEVRLYPNVLGLQRELAAYVNRDPEEVVVTAGADGAIDRVMRAFAGPGTRVVVLDPTFEMIPIYAAGTGAEVVRIPWGDELPLQVLLDVGRGAAVVAIVTPDNPTGRVVATDTILEVARQLPGSIVLLDHAYVEYADADATTAVRQCENVVVTRTLSKAWGLAGLRVGYALAAPPVAARLRAVGSPYPVSGVSAAIAQRCLAQPGYVSTHIERVRWECGELSSLLAELGARPTRSQANFVFARFDDAPFVAEALRKLGVEVRRFERAGLEDALRIGCPGSEAGFAKLQSALTKTLAPDVLLFDMDGVLADVRASYRQAIVATCATFGAEVNAAEVTADKRRPESNDDFAVTRRMLADRGVDVAIEDVSREFQRRYDAGLWAEEALLAQPAFLERLRGRYRLGIVTGRPRGDAERFLEMMGIGDLFEVVVCREDAALKPDPAPVRLALQRLGGGSAWMFGDTVDDIAAARAAGVLPIGVAAPEEFDDATTTRLAQAGAATTVANITEVAKWLS